MKSLKGTQTHINLMKSFAGESQARNRYTFYAEAAQKQGYPLIQKLFEDIAAQEQMHAKVFYQHLLQEFNGQQLEIQADYPVDFYQEDTLENLRASIAAEKHEHKEVYPAFAEVARNEGFPKIAAHFEMIGNIEDEHSRKFIDIATQLEEKTLFKKADPIAWECQVCGHIHFGVSAPTLCVVCQHPKGHFQEVKLSAAVMKKLKSNAK